MSKIICDICGTSYPDTAEKCPICGCSRDAAAEFLGDDFQTEEFIEEPKGKGGRFTNKKKKEIFDFDEVNAPADPVPVEEEENPYEEEEEVYEERKGHNVFVVILLTVLIAALLLGAGFIFVRYYLPNLGGDEEVTPVETTAAVDDAVPETTELSIPCKTLALTSGTPELTKEGQNFLLHVQPSPEDTTDKITYTSEDESIATVTEDGKVTAVSEGETIIYITCGNIQVPCPVVVHFEEETIPPTEATVAETIAETVPETTAAATEPKAPASDVKLKLKQTDIILGVYYEYQLMLDCGLEQNQVEWKSEHPHIATVDENGVVKAVKDGTTSIIVKYGDQEVSCIVRCRY